MMMYMYLPLMLVPGVPPAHQISHCIHLHVHLLLRCGLSINSFVFIILVLRPGNNREKCLPDFVHFGTSIYMHLATHSCSTRVSYVVIFSYSYRPASTVACWANQVFCRPLAKLLHPLHCRQNPCHSFWMKKVAPLTRVEGLFSSLSNIQRLRYTLNIVLQQFILIRQCGHIVFIIVGWLVHSLVCAW